MNYFKVPAMEFIHRPSIGKLRNGQQVGKAMNELSKKHVIESMNESVFVKKTVLSELSNKNI